jgi:cyclohexanecarboxylate-CoA ligase
MTARLRATWVPHRAASYRRPGGPWEGPTLDALVSRHGGEVVDGDTRMSAAQVEGLVAAVAGGLRARGVRRGEAVAWQLPNSLAAAVLTRACWRIGAVAAPILHSFGRAEVDAALAQIDPAALVEVPAEAVARPDAIAGAVAGGVPVPAGALPVRGSDVALVLFTSGSTGTPKAVLHTHRGLSWKARLMTRVHGLGPGDAVLMPAPLAHVSGLLNGVLVPGASGMKAVLVRRFDPEHALHLVGRERVSFMAGPPTFFIAMAAALSEGSGQGADVVRSVRLISSGGASVTPAFVEDTSRVFDCRVKRTYGSTECPTVTTSTDDDPFEKARDTDGRAVGEVELRVSDPGNGRRRRPGAGAPGELWVRGPELFAGYADAAQNAPVVARGGWFRSGDLATVDEDGWLRIVGRLKDVIIRGGENISASEIEGVLEAHPDVRHAVAVGYPDPLMGERVAAFVESAAPFDLEACRRWFASRGVATFKTPERVERVDRLPLLGSGKADRAALQRRAAASSSA